MTSKEKIQYLKQYKYLDNHIDRLLEEKEKWRARAEKITPTISDMPNGGDGENQRELAICEMMDCEVEINRLIDQLDNLRQQIRGYISETGEKDNDLLEVLRIEE